MKDISEQRLMETEWSQELDTNSAYRRASGRRNYNAVRRFI